MRQANIWLAIAILTLMSSSAYAETEKVLTPPPQLPNIDDLSPTLEHPPTGNILLGKLIVEPEHTALEEIQKFINAGEIYHRGDAGGSEYWICYTVSARNQSERIWFSSGELGGESHAIGSFYATVRDKKDDDLQACPELPSQFQPPSLGNSLWLGDSLEQLKKRLGEPSAKLDSWWFYSSVGTVLINGGSFDRLSILGVQVSDDKVIGLYESQATTN